MPEPRTHHTCPRCGKIFRAIPRQLHCSRRCGRTAPDLMTQREKKRMRSLEKMLKKEDAHALPMGTDHQGPA